MANRQILTESGNRLLTEDGNDLLVTEDSTPELGTRRMRRYAHIKQKGMKHRSHGHRLHSILLFITGLINGY